MNKRLIKKLENKEKRKSFSCKVFETKVDKSHLSTSSENHLHTLFKEAKWFYNYCLSHENINDTDTTIKEVPVKVKDVYETRTFKVLAGQMKQAIKERLIWSLKSLNSLKKKGYKVGKLKFKSIIHSIPLKQFNMTYFIKNNKIRIVNMNQWMKVHGLNQIPTDAEIACATLIRKDDDFYIHITTYCKKEKKNTPNISIGVDFGCETQLTFSNGVKVKFQVPVSKRLKRLDRKIMKKKRKDSKNKQKDKAKRRKAYQKLTNKRTDIRHKVVSAITKNYKYVIFQDESIHAWHSSNHGKKVQFSGIGGILSDLKNKAETPVEVDRFFPSTKLCPNCGKKNTLALSDRIYVCDCGFKMDRDVKSAICIKEEGIKQLPAEHREEKPEDISASTFMDTLSKIISISCEQVGVDESGSHCLKG